MRFLYDSLITLKYADTQFNIELKKTLLKKPTISRHDIVKLIDDNFGFA